MNRQRVLIVDHEIHIMELMRYNLENQGYSVDMTQFKDEAKDELEKNKYDLLLINVEFMPFIQSLDSKLIVPVLLVTDKESALGLEEEISNMRKMDYIVKPYTVQDLLSRIKFLLANCCVKIESTDHEDILRKWDLTINRTSFTVTQGNKELFLTYKEFELLYYLVQNAGQVCMREAILEKVWGYEYLGESRTVDVHIRNLRKKIESEAKQPYILTIRGVGYKFIDE